MNAQRPDPSNCDHLRVSIEAIEKPFSERTQSRLLRGNCQVCTGTVRRQMTAAEIKTGIPTTPWN
jgi:hypothetical protein